MNYNDRVLVEYFKMRGLYGDRRIGPGERYLAWDHATQWCMTSHHDWKRRKKLLWELPSWVEHGIASLQLDVV